MRDLAALLNSLVNIDRHSLIAILVSEAEAAQRSENLLDNALPRSAQNNARPWIASLGSTRSCAFSNAATLRRTCASATSNFANPLNKSCVREPPGDPPLKERCGIHRRERWRLRGSLRKAAKEKSHK